MSSNIDKLTNTFCDQLTNLNSILTHNVDLNRPQGSSSSFSQEQSLVVTTRHKKTRKRHHHEVSSLEDSDDSDGNDTPSHKSTKFNSHHSFVQSAAPAHKDDDKVSIPDEEEMNRNLIALQWESDNSNSGKEGIDDGEDEDFKELAQELNKEKGLGEPVQQTFANILETVWQNPQSYEKMKDKMKIYARPENCSSLVKKCNKEIWKVHLTSRDRDKDLHFQKIQTAVLKSTISITQVTSGLVNLKNNRELTAKDIRKSIIPVIKTCTEVMTFLGHPNQEADYIRRTNIAMLLPKDVYNLAKDVPIPSELLFGDDVHARIINIKAQ